MSIEFDAVYENGVLKPDHPLPLAESQRVRVVIGDRVAIARSLFGIMGFRGSHELAEKIAMDPDFGAIDSP